MPDSYRPDDAPFDGRWWLPDDPSAIVGGRLELKGLEGTDWQIVLLGWLGSWDPAAGWGEFPPRLHGHVGTTPVTLLGLAPAEVVSGLGAAPHRAAMSVQRVIFGVHLDESTLFERATVRLLNLNEWANRRPWSEEFNVDEVSGKPRTAGVYIDPGFLETSVPGAKVTLGRSFSQSSSQFSELKMTSDEWVGFVFGTPLDLAAIEHDYVRPLKYLVELGGGAHSGVLELTVTPQGSGPHDSPAVVVSSVDARADAKPKAWFRFLFTLSHVPFDQVIPTWWALHSHIGRVSDLVANLWDGSRSISDRFLDGATAIEGYHRHKFPGLSVTFAQRVDAVVALAGTRFATTIGDPVKWRNWVRDGRNSGAHQDPSMVDLEKEWRTTIGVAASIQWLLVLVLLADLGIPESVFEEGLRQNRILEQISTYLRNVRPDWF